MPRSGQVGSEGRDLTPTGRARTGCAARQVCPPGSGFEHGPTVLGLCLPVSVAVLKWPGGRGAAAILSGRRGRQPGQI